MAGTIFRIDAGYGKTIVMRPRSEGECYPTHKLVRIIIGGTVHAVQGYNVYTPAVALLCKPEEKWKKCPHCGKKDWSAWMPSPIHVRRFFREAYDHEIQMTQWYILCIHCSRLVEMHSTPPDGIEATEYIYDPADDRPLWKPPKQPDAQRPPRRRKR